MCRQLEEALYIPRGQFQIELADRATVAARRLPRQWIPAPAPAFRLRHSLGRWPQEGAFGLIHAIVFIFRRRTSYDIESHGRISMYVERTRVHGGGQGLIVTSLLPMMRQDKPRLQPTKVRLPVKDLEPTVLL